MKKYYKLSEFELTMVFVIILALWIGFGIFLYVTDKDNPKLESREISQSEEVLNTNNSL